MGRPSTLPTFPNVKACQRALFRDETVALIARTKSGSEYAHLLSLMVADDARCIVCNLPTLHTRWDGPATATLGHLVPPSVILGTHCDPDDMPAGEASRVGYVPGNMGVMCRACIDAATAYGAATGEPVVWGEGLAGLDRVWCAWPSLRKGAGRPTDPTGDEFRAIARAARDHALNAARERASQGLPF
jgi:hypothetical protein